VIAASRAPRVAAVGLASWDRFVVVDRQPVPGSYPIVHEEASLPGGTTTNSAAMLARLGAHVSLAAYVGDDADGEALRAAMIAAGVDVAWLRTRAGTRTDGATIVVSRTPPERTILWRPGAQLVRGDRLDVAALFAHDLVLLDVADAPLRRFLVDLPAHTAPGARLLGTLTYLADAGLPDALEIALRHDAMTGNDRQLLALVGAETLDDALALVRTRLVGNNLRTWVVSRGAAGCSIVTPTERWDVPAFPVEAVDTTGAGDAFAAGIAYGMARRWDWPRIGRLANAAAALSTRALGAQTALPSRAEVASLLGEDAATLFA